VRRKTSSQGGWIRGGHPHKEIHRFQRGTPPQKCPRVGFRGLPSRQAHAVKGHKAVQGRPGLVRPGGCGSKKNQDSSASTRRGSRGARKRGLARGTWYSLLLAVEGEKKLAKKDREKGTRKRAGKGFKPAQFQKEPGLGGK